MNQAYFIGRKGAFMALINEYYVFVKDESMSYGVTATEHPVESGLNITDNVKRNAKIIKITGEIVGQNAAQTLSKIAALHTGGKYVKYSGRNVMSNALITSFETDHPNTIYGGCGFTMEIKEVRIAKTPVAQTKAASSVQQVKTKPKAGVLADQTYTIKSGDTLWSIATSYYGNGGSYTLIQRANPTLKATALYVGSTITIPNAHAGGRSFSGSTSSGNGGR